MTSLNTDLFIRMAKEEDIPACQAVDVEAWGPDSAASEAMLRSRIASCPFGNFIAKDRTTDEIVGSVWTISTVEKPVVSWQETSGDGMYGSACDPHGDFVFGVNLSVRPAHAGRGVGQALAVHGVEAAWMMGKRKLQLGSRIPHFHKWQDVFRVDDYVHLLIGGDHVYFRNPETDVLHEGPPFQELRAELARTGALLEPRGWPAAALAPLHTRAFDGELAFFLDIMVRGRRCRPFRPLPDYFPDPDSCNYGVLIGWENPEHPANFRKP